MSAHKPASHDLPRDVALAALAKKAAAGVTTPRPSSPSTHSPKEGADSSIIIHSDADTSADSVGGSFEDVSLGSHRQILRAISTVDADKSITSHPLGAPPITERPEETSSAESGGPDSSFEVVGASDTSLTDSPRLGTGSSPGARRTRLALETDSRPGSTTSASVKPALSPIPEPGAPTSATDEGSAHLNPAAHEFEPTGEGEIVGRIRQAQVFAGLVSRTKEEWGDLNREGRKELSEMGLKPIPAMHGPLSLPYARCPSGIDAFLFSADKDEDPWTFVLDGDEPRSGRRPGGSNFRVNPVPLPGNARYSQPGFRQHQLVNNSRPGGSALTSSAGRTTSRNASGMTNASWRQDPPGPQRTSTPPLRRKGRGNDEEEMSWTQQVVEQRNAFGPPHQQAQVGQGPSFGEGWGYAANLNAFSPPTQHNHTLSFFPNAPTPAVQQAQAQAQAQANYAASQQAQAQAQAQAFFPAYAGSVAPLGINPSAGIAGAGGGGGQSFPFGQAGQAAAANLIAASYQNSLVAAGGNPWGAPLLLGIQPGPAFVDPAIVSLRAAGQQPLTQQQLPRGLGFAAADDCSDRTEVAPTSEGEWDDRQSGFSFPDNTSRRSSLTVSHNERRRSGSGPSSSIIKGRRNSAAPAIPQHGRELSATGSRKPSLSPAVAVAPRRSSIAPKTRLVKDSNLVDSRGVDQLGGLRTSTPVRQPALLLTEATPAHSIAMVPHHSRRSSVAACAGAGHGGPSLEATLMMAAQVEATNKALSNMLASSLANMNVAPPSEAQERPSNQRRASASRGHRQASSESGSEWGLWGKQNFQQATPSGENNRKVTTRSSGVAKENRPAATSDHSTGEESKHRPASAVGKAPPGGLSQADSSKSNGRGGVPMGRGRSQRGGMRSAGGSWRAAAK